MKSSPTSDPELEDWLTPCRLGKRLSNLWPHLRRNLTEAMVGKDRKVFTVYSFRTKSVVLS